MLKQLLVTMICSAFAAAALVLLFLGRADAVTGFTTLAMFGGGGVFSLSQLLQNREEAARLPGPIAEGVVYPLRRRQYFWIGLWLITIGLPGAIARRTDGLFWLTDLVGAFGLIFVVLVASGFRREVFLFLGPDGLRVGQRGYSYLVRWSNVKSISVGAFSGQPLVVLAVVDPQQVVAEPVAGGDLARASARLSKAMQTYRTWYGGDVAVMPRQCGLTATGLAQAIDRAVLRAGGPARGSDA